MKFIKYIYLFIIYFNTIKYLKFSQIFYRIKKIYFKKFKKLNTKIKFFKLSNIPIKTNSFLEKNIEMNENYIVLLNKKVYLYKLNWNNSNYNKLLIYNLNYFDFLLSKYANNNTTFCIRIINKWIKNCQNQLSDAWDPYPTSRRLINWIKWIKKNEININEINISIYLQTRWLYKNLEYDLLGNHIIANCSSLIISGSYFDTEESNKWLKKGIKLLINQIDEQILKDGCHFERSTMYHSIILLDLLDVLNFTYQISEKNNNYSSYILFKKINFVVEKMFSWQNKMTHLDNKLSFFGDAAVSDIREIHDLQKYAKNIGININLVSTDKLANMNDSGFISFNNTKYKIILNVGNIKANYIPGHSHADPLSYELSIFDEKIISNCGVSDYNNSERRILEKGTSFHNTVKINNLNASEMWESFRVGRRSYVDKPIIKLHEARVEVNCNRQDYHTYNNQHFRKWELSDNSIIITDRINKNKNAYSYIILNENYSINKINSKYFKIITKNLHCFFINILYGEVEINNFKIAKDFGKLINTKRFRIKLLNNKCKYMISFNNS